MNFYPGQNVDHPAFGKGIVVADVPALKETRVVFERDTRIVQQLTTAQLMCVGWKDAPLPEDAEIDEEFPTRATASHAIRSPDARWEDAMRLVGAKRSKFALVALVNWLLAQLDERRADSQEYNE